MGYATKQCPHLGARFTAEDREIWICKRLWKKRSRLLASICSCKFLGGGTVWGAGWQCFLLDTSPCIFPFNPLHHPVTHAWMLSHFSSVRLSAAPWIVAHQAPLSIRILQARILQLDAISFPRGSSWPQDQTHISCIGRRILYHWATREATRKVLLPLAFLGKTLSKSLPTRQSPLWKKPPCGKLGVSSKAWRQEREDKGQLSVNVRPEILLFQAVKTLVWNEKVFWERSCTDLGSLSAEVAASPADVTVTLVT